MVQFYLYISNLSSKSVWLILYTDMYTIFIIKKKSRKRINISVTIFYPCTVYMSDFTL